MQIEWRRSTKYKEAHCVEIGAIGRRSTKCESHHCVAVDRPAVDQVHMRDSKNPDGPVLTFGAGAWRVFLAGLKR
jgi:hypothetical protein